MLTLCSPLKKLKGNLSSNCYIKIESTAKLPLFDLQFRKYPIISISGYVYELSSLIPLPFGSKNLIKQ